MKKNNAKPNFGLIQNSVDNAFLGHAEKTLGCFSYAATNKQVLLELPLLFWILYFRYDVYIYIYIYIYMQLYFNSETK